MVLDIICENGINISRDSVEKIVEITRVEQRALNQRFKRNCVPFFLQQISFLLFEEPTHLFFSVVVFVDRFL